MRCFDSAVPERGAPPMKVREPFALPRIHQAVVGLAVLGMLATAAPVRADDDVKGWFVALDIAMTQPYSLDQSFATHIDQSATPFKDTRLVMDNDSDMTYRASVGYVFGKGLGNLRV